MSTEADEGGRRDAASSPALRGHHLFCLHFFAGDGYDARFVANLRRVMRELAAGPGVIVDGADDVCAACAHLRDGACEAPGSGEAEIRRIDSLSLELLGVRTGDAFAFAEVGDRLPAALARWRSEACEGCEWSWLCLPQMNALERPAGG